MATTVRDSSFHLERILWKSSNQEPLSRGEIRFLLELRDGRDIACLSRAARELRRRHFDDTVFLYGFVYFSTWCRNDCTYCLYRRSNPLARRYRKDRDEILEIAYRLIESGVHLIDLTMGEDPFFYQNGQRFVEIVGLVKTLKADTGILLMVSPGVVAREVLRALSLAGADWYACYQETHNPALFSRLRPGQNYEERLMRKREARQLGLLVEEGILTGVGDSLRYIVNSVEAMRAMAAHQVRVMTFVPQRGTPLHHVPPPLTRRELITIAVLRILFPDRLITASLDVGGIAGLQDRLHAGANVVTSLIPPHAGLAGVSQNSLDIETGYRTVKGVLPILKSMGLKIATGAEYLRWVRFEKDQLV